MRPVLAPFAAVLAGVLGAALAFVACLLVELVSSLALHGAYEGFALPGFVVVGALTLGFAFPFYGVLRLSLRGEPGPAQAA